MSRWSTGCGSFLSCTAWLLRRSTATSLWRKTPGPGWEGFRSLKQGSSAIREFSGITGYSKCLDVVVGGGHIYLSFFVSSP